MTDFRDRIIDFKRVKASALVHNKQNWRVHSERQRNALEAVYDSIGVVSSLLVRPTADGNYEILDGHLRHTMHDADAEVPVLVLDLNDDEAKQMLATYDPITGWANADLDMLAELLEGLDTKALTDPMVDLLEDLKDDTGLTALLLDNVEVGAAYQDPQHEFASAKNVISSALDVRLFSFHIPRAMYERFEAALTQYAEGEMWEERRPAAIALRIIANELADYGDIWALADPPADEG